MSKIALIFFFLSFSSNLNKNRQSSYGVKLYAIKTILQSKTSYTYQTEFLHFNVCLFHFRYITRVNKHDTTDVHLIGPVTGLTNADRLDVYISSEYGETDKRTFVSP